jgi:hypothetical protein
VIFKDNTFSLRSGGKITKEFPVITGLREGSVLSLFLFVLFVAGMAEDVLRPFGRTHFLQKDPCLNLIPVPGLLYADDLVLICLTADGLRERLRRLKTFATASNLTVNVAKSEVVVFGRGPVASRFKFNGELIPVRASCKYLGVWLDQAMSGWVFAEAVLQKFVGAIPTFFLLCRRLRFSRIDLVHRLASSLLFS